MENTKRVLILDNAIDYNVYRPVEHWAPHLIYPFDVFRASMGELPKDIDPYSHVIVTGSEASIMDDADWMRAEEEVIREAVESGKVVLGSCFGHQLVARALYGMDVVRRREYPGVGWRDIKVRKNDKLFGLAGGPINSLLIHFDEVCNLPLDQVDILATSDYCDVQAFKLKDKPVWGIQPHPEIGIEEGLAIMDKIAEKRTEHKKRFLDARESKPIDSEWIAYLMAEFQRVEVGQ